MTLPIDPTTNVMTKETDIMNRNDGLMTGVMSSFVEFNKWGVITVVMLTMLLVILICVILLNLSS